MDFAVHKNVPGKHPERPGTNRSGCPSGTFMYMNYLNKKRSGKSRSGNVPRNIYRVDFNKEKRS